MACKKGFIELIVGCMFSGKTTELQRICRRSMLAGKKVFMIKYLNDARYEDKKIVTHDKISISAEKTILLLELYEKALQYDVIGIDEGQFFPDIVQFSDNLANNGKVVVIAALNSDYKRNAFPVIGNLLAIAEKVNNLTAICKKCGNEAAFSYRTTSNNEIELIGGSEIYQALCRECYNELVPWQ